MHPIERIIRQPTLPQTMLGFFLGMVSMEAFLYLWIARPPLSDGVGIAFTVMLAMAFWSPWAIMDRLGKRLPLNVGEYPEPKQRYTRLFYIAGFAAVLMAVITVLVLSHGLGLWLAGVPFWFVFVFATVFGWAYKHCPF